MLKRLTMTMVILALVFPVGIVAGVGPEEAGRVVTIPDWAIEVAPGVLSLGTVMHDGRVAEGFAIIHYDDSVGIPERRCEFARPGTECGNGICEPGENRNNCPADCGGNGGGSETSDCYAFLARGAKWKSVEPWVVNPTNSEGLGDAFIFSNLAGDIAKWESAAGVDILGDGSITYDVLVEDWYNPDGLNEVLFGSISDPGAIAVTIVWGYFSGPPRSRELIEWDQVYDEVDFDWSDSGEAGKMDFENIATHELGHSVGLGDLYTSDCSEVTMYGYADYGETKKSSLEDGDINGIRQLYS